jgi:chromate transporter
MSIFMLFCTFFYIGLFTIGGGVVALTLMQQTIVEKGLIDSQTFYNMVAISESTPGPLGINMATYIGYKLYGVPGGIIATAGEVLPSLICIMIIAHFLKKFSDNAYVKGTLAFLRPVSTGLVLLPFIQIFVFALLNVPQSQFHFSAQSMAALFKWKNIAAWLVFVFVFFRFKVHPIFVIAAGALFGILFL